MTIKIHILKKIDQLVGRLIAFFPKTSGTQYPIKTNIRKVLFIRPGGIGDATLLIPAICILKKKLPYVLISVLAEKRNAAVFYMCPIISELFLYDKPKELLKVIRSEFDVVIDTEQWHLMSAVVARMEGSAVSIGFATNERKRLFTHLVPYSHDDYEGDSFFHLLEPLGVVAENGVLSDLITPDEAIKKAVLLLGDFEKKPFVAIFPGSSVPEKRWDVSKFVMLTKVLNQVGFPVIVIGSALEKATGEVISYNNDVLNIAGKTSLLETAAVINKALVLISGDSGVLHIAAGLGRPTVSLFGPSNVKKWAPRGGRHIVISKDLECSPCSKFGYTPKCPINAKCMAEISVDEVVEAVIKLIEASQSV